jgi:ketosteroid isomerase-like protein
MDPEYTDKFLSTVSAAATATPRDPLVALHAVYDAIIKGDFDAIGESMSDDVELNINGFAPLDGAWKGRREVVAAAKRNYAQVESQQPTIDGMISQGDSVAVLMRESGVVKSSREAYSIRAVQWFTFADGKIRKIDQIAASIWKVAD